MTCVKPEVGHWYILSYGFDEPIGRCVSVGEKGAVMSFRWGGPFRQNHFVRYDEILIEAPDPRLFGLMAALKRGIVLAETGR